MDHQLFAGGTPCGFGLFCSFVISLKCSLPTEKFLYKDKQNTRWCAKRDLLKNDEMSRQKILTNEKEKKYEKEMRAANE